MSFSIYGEKQINDLIGVKLSISRYTHVLPMVNVIVTFVKRR